MTDSDVIERALEMIRVRQNVEGYSDVVVTFTRRNRFASGYNAGNLQEPLAALIRDAAKPWFSEGVKWCRVCGCRYDAPHADDDTDWCALVALCKAITGETT